jgi:alpha-1,2-glucosyltransferase
LFFFSGLYYTDVQSAFWVVLAYQSYLRYQRHGFASWSDAFSQIKFGIIALFFRQTNIFWVAVLPAGLALIASVHALPNNPKVTNAPRQSWLTICAQSWNDSMMYDLPVYEARIEGRKKLWQMIETL